MRTHIVNHIINKEKPHTFYIEYALNEDAEEYRINIAFLVDAETEEDTLNIFGNYIEENDLMSDFYTSHYEIEDAEEDTTEFFQCDNVYIKMPDMITVWH